MSRAESAQSEKISTRRYYRRTIEYKNDKHKHAANNVDKTIIFSLRRSQSLHFFVSSTIVIVGFFVLDVPILFVVVVGRR